MSNKVNPFLIFSYFPPRTVHSYVKHYPPLPMDIELINSGSFPHMLFIATILLVYTFQLFTFLMSIPRLLELHRFYEHLLGVPDVRPFLNPPLYISSNLYLHSLLSPLWPNYYAQYMWLASLTTGHLLTTRSISKPSPGLKLLN